jgi:hypothetical protein
VWLVFFGVLSALAVFGVSSVCGVVGVSGVLGVFGVAGVPGLCLLACACSAAMHGPCCASEPGVWCLCG